MSNGISDESWAHSLLSQEWAKFEALEARDWHQILTIHPCMSEWWVVELLLCTLWYISNHCAHQLFGLTDNFNPMFLPLRCLVVSFPIAWWSFSLLTSSTISGLLWMPETSFVTTEVDAWLISAKSSLLVSSLLASLACASASPASTSSQVLWGPWQVFSCLPRLSALFKGLPQPNLHSNVLASHGVLRFKCCCHAQLVFAMYLHLWHFFSTMFAAVHTIKLRLLMCICPAHYSCVPPLNPQSFLITDVSAQKVPTACYGFIALLWYPPVNYLQTTEPGQQETVTKRRSSLNPFWLLLILYREVRPGWCFLQSSQSP